LVYQKSDSGALVKWAKFQTAIKRGEFGDTTPDRRFLWEQSAPRRKRGLGEGGVLVDGSGMKMGNLRPS